MPQTGRVATASSGAGRIALPVPDPTPRVGPARLTAPLDERRSPRARWRGPDLDQVSGTLTKYPGQCLLYLDQGKSRAIRLCRSERREDRGRLGERAALVYRFTTDDCVL